MDLNDFVMDLFCLTRAACRQRAQAPSVAGGPCVALLLAGCAAPRAARHASASDDAASRAERTVTTVLLAALIRFLADDALEGPRSRDAWRRAHAALPREHARPAGLEPAFPGGRTSSRSSCSA